MSEKQIHILVVDDEIELSNVLGEALELEDFKVTIFNSAVEALEKVLDIDFEVVISDHNMPEMNGDEFFLKLKEKMDRPFFFYLSTGDMDIDEGEMQEMGVTKLVMKPYNIFELCDEIKERCS